MITIEHEAKRFAAPRGTGLGALAAALPGPLARRLPGGGGGVGGGSAARPGPAGRWVEAVKDVSLHAANGRITGLLGPNGAGKTTTLRMLGGLFPPDAGRITVDGLDAGRDSGAALARMGILGDAHGLYPRLTARENIVYFGRLQGLDAASAQARCEALADLLDLRGVLDRRAEGFNPLCGDRLTLFVRLDGETIADVSFQGSGCAISVASASLLTEAVKGRSVADAERLFGTMHDLLTRDDVAVDVAALGKLGALSGVREFPARVKCASLCWHTLDAALHRQDEPVRTE